MPLYDFAGRLNETKVLLVLIISVIAIGLFITLLTINTQSVLYLIMIIGFLVMLALTFRYPEVVFALFLASGAFKTYKILGSISAIFDLTAVLGFFSFIGAIYVLKKTKTTTVTFPKILFLLYFLIVIFAALSLAYSPAQNYGFEKLLKLITLTTFSFVAPFFLLRNTISLKRFLKVFIIIGIFMIADVFVRGLNIQTIGFYSALGSDYIMFGRIEGFAFISCMLFFFINSNTLLGNIAYVLTSIALLFGVLISASRGPLFALALSVFSISLFIFARAARDCFRNLSIKKLDLKIIKVFVTTLLAVLILFCFFSGYFTTLFYRITKIGTGIEDSLIERLSMYSKAMQVIESFPINLRGLGLGGYSVFYTGVDSKFYPHNIFLEIGSELGIFVLIIFVVLVIFVFVHILKRVISSKELSSSSLSLTILGLFIFVVVNASLSHDVNDNRILFTLMSMAFSVKDVKSATQA